jgi:hypothetical protein
MTPIGICPKCWEDEGDDISVGATCPELIPAAKRLKERPSIANLQQVMITEKSSYQVERFACPPWPPPVFPEPRFLRDLGMPENRALAAKNRKTYRSDRDAEDTPGRVYLSRNPLQITPSLSEIAAQKGIESIWRRGRNLTVDRSPIAPFTCIIFHRSGDTPRNVPLLLDAISGWPSQFNRRPCFYSILTPAEVRGQDGLRTS